jgi:hypothetical protein
MSAEGTGTYAKFQAAQRATAAAPELLALVRQAVVARIDDEWLRRAREVLARVDGPGEREDVHDG